MEIKKTNKNSSSMYVNEESREEKELVSTYSNQKSPSTENKEEIENKQKKNKQSKFKNKKGKKIYFLKNLLINFIIS